MVSVRMGQTLQGPPAHFVQGTSRLGKKEQEDPVSFCLTELWPCVWLLGPGLRCPRRPQPSWPQWEMQGPRQSHGTKPDSAGVSIRGLAMGTVRGNTPLPLSMGDLFSEAQNAADRPHRGRLFSRRASWSLSQPNNRRVSSCSLEGAIVSGIAAGHLMHG